MAYEKRVCVLKQIKKGFSADGGALSGAVYVERLGERLTLTPRIANLAPLKEGRYALAVWTGGKIFCMELRANAPIIAENAPSLCDGVSVLLCYLRGEAEPLAYGYCGRAPVTYGALLNAFSQEAEEQKKPKRPPVACAQEEETEEPAPPFCGEKPRYDDEAIASADYFAIAGDENASAPACGEEQAGTNKTCGDACPHDGAVHPIEFPRGKLAYYREVSEKIEQAFAKYPHDDRLRGTFPQSDWVNSDGTLLGVIYEEGRPRYLCVAAEKTKDGAPKPMRERAVFVPVSPFSDDEGFYIVFQDADTGEYVTVSQA